MKHRIPFLLTVLLVTVGVVHVLGVLFDALPDSAHDFRSFYMSAEQWKQGFDPYVTLPAIPPNLEPPITLLFWRLWTYLPYFTAFHLWTLLSLTCGIVGVIWATRLTGWQWPEIAGAVFAGTPFLLGLAEGQPFLVFLLLMTAAWAFARKGESVLPGLLIGVLGAVKPFFGVFGLWWLWKRDWRAAGTAAGTVLTLHTVGFLVVGPEATWRWLDALHNVDWTGHAYNMSVWGIGARLFSPTDTEMSAAYWTPIVVSPLLARLSILIAGLVVASIGVRALRTSDTDRSFAILCLLGMLLSPLGWIHYLPIALGPLLAVLTPRRGILLLALNLIPHNFIIGQYGVAGTLIVGSWALALGITASVAALREPTPLHSSRIAA